MAVAQCEFRAQMLPLFLRCARQAGTAIGPLLKRFGLPEDAWKRSEITVSIGTLQEVLTALAEAQACPHIGLLAANFPRGTYGLFEFSLRSASTLREAYARMVRSALLLDELSVATFEEVDARGVVRTRVPREPLCFGRQGNELVVGFIVRLLRECSRGAREPLEVWFAHPQPPDAKLIASYLGTDLIRYGCGHNEVVVAATDLDLSMPEADSALLAFLETQVEEKLRLWGGAESFVSRVEQRIRLMVPGQVPTLEVIAEALHMSSRTLQRKLAEHDVRFSDLLDRARLDAARARLAQPSLSLSEIAYSLGYSDVAAFVRAFRRWTGATPAKYREQLQRGR